MVGRDQEFGLVGDLRLLAPAPLTENVKKEKKKKEEKKQEHKSTTHE